MSPVKFRDTVVVISFLAIGSLTSCLFCDEEDYCESYSTGELIVKVPINEDNPYVAIELYKYAKLIKKDTLYKERKVYEKPNRKAYTVKAYIQDGETLEERAITHELYPNVDSCGCDNHGGIRVFDFQPEE